MHTELGRANIMPQNIDFWEGKIKKPHVGAAQIAPRSGPSPAPFAQHKDRFGELVRQALARSPAHATEP